MGQLILGLLGILLLVAVASAIVNLVVAALSAVVAFLAMALPVAAAVAVAVAALRVALNYWSLERMSVRQEERRSRELEQLVAGGRFGEFIAQCASRDDGTTRLRDTVSERLGPAAQWPAGAALRDLADELLLLERSRVNAVASGVPPELTTGVAATWQELADQLWQQARRLAAIAVEDAAGLPKLARRLQAMREQAVQALDSVRATRDDLAELTLTLPGPTRNGSLTEAERRLRATTTGWQWLVSHDSGHASVEQPQPADSASPGARATRAERPA